MSGAILPDADALPTDPGSGISGIERTIEVLHKIKAGTIAGKTLAPADRRQVVVFLAADGMSTPEIAQILQVSDRSVERDKRAIRESNAIPNDPKLVEQMVGRLMAEAELSVQRIRRAVREKEVDAAVRVDGEHRCFLIVNELVHSLQRLGYLPLATQRVQADLTHHVGSLPSFDELRAEVDRLKQIGGPDSAPEVIELEGIVTRAEVASRVKQLTGAVDADEAPADPAEGGGQ